MSPDDSGTTSTDDPFAGKRARMVERQLRRRGITDERVLQAMGEVPRERFVPESERARAYRDGALRIGEGQTISQPWIVACMASLLDLSGHERVLEVGTGSGYQAAILAETGARVWTIEIFEALAREARDRLRRLGYSRVNVRHGDGYAGWPEASPFDAIVVTAAADSIPPALLRQLAPRGRLVMPVGDPETHQDLVLVQKDAEGRLASRQLIPVRFVPLLRGVR
jgi:protein-L-isoaspartate(D-aspartate) O-methyltransferase